MYYLKTRYYDPEICRFISMDDVAYIDPETIGGTNLFAYCNNNPVMNVDPSGTFVISLSAVIIGCIIGGVVGVGTTPIMIMQTIISLILTCLIMF